MPSIVLFGAIWCGPCKQQKTILDTNQIPYEYVDIDEPCHKERVRAANIRTVPTMHIIKDGSLAHVKNGLIFKKDLMALLAK
jgi:glutaredoxin